VNSLCAESRSTCTAREARMHGGAVAHEENNMTKLTRIDPFAEFDLFSDWRRPLATPRIRTISHRSNAAAAWRPAVDVRETADTYAISFELPGTEKEDVSVEVHDGVLTVKGEKKASEVAEGERRHHIERVYGSFTRAFTLPTDVEGDAVKATFRNGVLTVEIPKAEEQKPKVVPIDA
jgi:HSP20 family protein